MAGVAGVLPDLTPVAVEAGAAEGDPRPVYTWAGPRGKDLSIVRSYTPSDGGAPRLVARCRGGRNLCVWHTGTGALLRALPCPKPDSPIFTFLTYQRPLDGRPRVAAGSERGHLSIWDGDDFRLLQSIETHPAEEECHVCCLAVYEQPISGGTRLVTG
jgi:WD40 repeat protein